MMCQALGQVFGMHGCTYVSAVFEQTVEDKQHEQAQYGRGGGAMLVGVL